MNTNLFIIDPMAASSYGLYNSVKKDEGSFVDFLLNYDSKKANEQDNSWFTDMVSEDTLTKIKSPEVLQSLNLSGISSEGMFSVKSYFDTKIEAYKLQLIQEMKKRDIPIPKEYEGADIYSPLLKL